MPEAITTADAPAPLTEVERVLNTYVAPTKTFLDIRHNRSWWLPFLLMCVSGYIFTFTAMSRAGMDTIVENTIKSNPVQRERLANQAPEARAQTLRITGISMRVSMYAWPVFMLLFASLAALLLWIGFNFLLGGTATFSGMFTVAIFANLPAIIRSLLSVAVLFAGDPDRFNLNDPVGTNPGFYMGAGTSVFLKSALSSVDIFTLWILALMAVGGAIVAAVKVRSGIIMVLTAWLVFVLGKATVVALF